MDKDILKMEEEDFRELINQESVAEAYSESDIPRGIIQMIPSLGPLIDGILAEPGSKYQKERRKSFLLLFYQALKKLEEKIDSNIIEKNKKYLNTEVFHDMFNIAYSSSIKSRSKEKLIMNVMILTNIISVKNDGEFIPEEYLYSLEQLSPNEIKILKLFYRYESEAKEKIVNEIGIEKEDLIFLLKKIEKSGFIKETNGALLSYTGGNFESTESLKRMMDYIAKHPFSDCLD